MSYGVQVCSHLSGLGLRARCPLALMESERSDVVPNFPRKRFADPLLPHSSLGGATSIKARQQAIAQALPGPCPGRACHHRPARASTASRTLLLTGGKLGNTSRSVDDGTQHLLRTTVDLRAIVSRLSTSNIAIDDVFQVFLTTRSWFRIEFRRFDPFRDGLERDGAVQHVLGLH